MESLVGSQTSNRTPNQKGLQYNESSEDIDFDEISHISQIHSPNEVQYAQQVPGRRKFAQEVQNNQKTDRRAER